ncbi:MAG: serine/threonine protein kinase [Polyangiaceae bacterium]|nr:serine/threonine protein kinase [Polyangiaceae bacterium]
MRRGATAWQAQVADLVAQERLREAAELSAQHGDVARALDLFERAALFAEAASCALALGQGARALTLAAFAGDDALLQRAAALVEPAEGRHVGEGLEARRLWRAAALAFERGLLPARAAEAWSRAGDALRAGARFEEAGDATGAARVLSAAHRQQPSDAPIALALGTLLARGGRFEAAARVLQSVEGDQPEAEAARALLAHVFDRLGLREASASLGPAPTVELTPLGGGGGARVLFGRYTVERSVASTPSSRVFAARDRLNDAPVAIKVLHTGALGLAGRDALARFEREAKTLASLRHPHVVPLLAFVPEGPAAIMPWMAGGSLAERLRGGPLRPDLAAEVVAAVLEALVEAHRLGVLHRDVKPSNVLFDEAGAAYLADFGAAHVSDSSATVTAGLLGSLAYMAPEQRAGRPATRRSDVYGVGALFFESLTGALPSSTDTPTPSTRPSQTHDDLDGRHDAFLARLLAADPGGRPEGAREALEELRALPWRALTPARPPRALPPSIPPPDRAPRLHPGAEGALWDATLERPLLVLEATPARLALARAFVRADHPALAAIYRLDAQAGTLWVEALAGRPLAALGRPLQRREAARLATALDALHAAGAAHGAVDAGHVYVDEAGARLAFPAQAAPGSRADDDEALARLAGAPPAGAGGPIAGSRVS